MTEYLALEAIFWGFCTGLSVYFIRGLVAEDRTVAIGYAVICVVQLGLAGVMLLV